MTQQILNKIKKLNLKAIELKKQGRLNDAIRYLEYALKLEPHPNTYFNLGILSYSKKDYSRALLCFKNIPPKESYNYYFFYGKTLEKLKQHEDAIPLYQKAKKLTGDNLEAELSLLDAYLYIGDHQNAEFAFSTLLERKLPYEIFARIQQQYSEYLIQHQEWGKALEAREKTYDQSFLVVDDIKIPRWIGQPSNCKTLYIISNEGVGDDIMYSVYLDALTKRFRRVFFECDKRLIPLLELNYPAITFIDKMNKRSRVSSLKQSDWVNFSYNLTPILPPTQLNNPHYLSLDETIRPKKNVIGISHSTTADNAHKRMPPKHFWQTIKESFPNISFIDLQAKQFDNVDLFNDFIGLSKIICQCQYIISIDNTVAHLTGRLGKDFSLLLSKGADYRWLMQNNSPWYPRANLLRQTKYSCWDDCLYQVVDKIEAIL